MGGEVYSRFGEIEATDLATCHTPNWISGVILFFIKRGKERKYDEDQEGKKNEKGEGCEGFGMGK